MVFKKPMGGILVRLVLTCLVAIPVTVYPLQAEETPRKQERRDVSIEEAPEPSIGVAVYYAKRYNGRRTHSGAVYRHQKLTAAHPTLPHGTQVKVINLTNNRSVIVTVTDRCRKRDYEFIDLSRSAASKLGFLGKGKATVRIIPLKGE